MATVHLTSTLDRTGWSLKATTRGRIVRDLKADWGRWSASERTVVLAIAAVWVAAIFAFATMTGA
jgi:hypothetical protein